MQMLIIQKITSENTQNTKKNIEKAINEKNNVYFLI